MAEAEQQPERVNEMWIRLPELRGIRTPLFHGKYRCKKNVWWISSSIWNKQTKKNQNQNRKRNRPENNVNFQLKLRRMQLPPFCSRSVFHLFGEITVAIVKSWEVAASSASSASSAPSSASPLFIYDFSYSVFFCAGANLRMGMADGLFREAGFRVLFVVEKIKRKSGPRWHTRYSQEHRSVQGHPQKHPPKHPPLDPRDSVENRTRSLG